MKGNPSCPKCNGSGGLRHRGRFVVCTCVRGDPAALRAQHERRMADPNFAAFIAKLRKPKPGGE